MFHMKKVIIILIIQLYAVYSFSQVTGKIVDENGLEAPGVNVLIKGTNNGTVSNISGEFQINATKGDTIAISFIGYESQELPVSQINQVFSIKLKPYSFEFDVTVVMGYSNKTKNEISSAVTTISSDKLIDSPSSDIGSLLQGKVSGLQVVNSSGLPGSSAEVRIRGVSTIKTGSAEPLYVVDGIIGGSFDPNDVESITVLKDAGSTGMYGARANKGVIVVTTKSAKSDKTTFEFKADYGLNIADQGNLQMMNSEQFYDWSSELYRDENTHSIDKIKFYDDYDQVLKTYDYDWVDLAFEPAPVQKYYLSARGKSNKLGYYISGSYFNEDGTLLKTGYEKINFRSNTKYDFNEKVSLKNNINLSASKGSTYTYMDLLYAYLGLPWDNPYNEDGSPRFIDGSNSDNTTDGSGWWSRDAINPFHDIDNSDYNYKGLTADYDMSLNVNIFDWLSFSSTNRLSYSTTLNHTYISPSVAGTYYGDGYIAEDESIFYGAITTNLLHFNKTFGIHSINGLAGVEAEKGISRSLGLTGQGLAEGYDVPSVASSNYTIEGTRSEEIFKSFISQFNYALKNTYFLTGSYRIDASSNFPSNNRVAHFPSVSGSILLNKLGFMNSLSMLDMLKVRASYGVTGDPDIGASRYLGLYSLETQYNGYSAATPYQLENSELTWEKTHQFNFGVDIDLYSRISFNFDLYNNVTKDLIVLASQPLSQGFESKYENAGQVINRGIELTLSTVNIQTHNFTFTSEFSFGTNKNELSGLDDPITTTINGVTQIYQNGSELYTFYMPKWLGVDSETGAPLWESITTDNVGNVISREATTNYDEAESQAVGHALPDFTGGINLMFSYKNFTLNVNNTFQYGNDVFNATRIYMDNDGHEYYYNQMVPKDDWSRWTKPGDEATQPSMQNNSLSTETSSRYLEDGSFFKIRTISFQYRLQKKWIDKTPLSAASISLTGNNLFTFTEFWGQDPEVTLTNQTYSMPGVSDFKYPNNKQYILSLNVKF